MSEQQVNDSYNYLRGCPLTAKQHEEIMVLFNEARHNRRFREAMEEKVQELKCQIVELKAGTHQGYEIPENSEIGRQLMNGGS